MKSIFAELRWIFTSPESGLRLSSAVLGFMLSLSLIINPNIFDSSPSYITLRAYPEWVFGVIFLVVSVFQMITERGFLRRSSLLMGATQWLFWAVFIYLSTQSINTGSAVYLGISLLTFYAFYLEIREQAS